MKRTIYSATVLTLGVAQLIESLAFSIPLSYFPNYVMELGASVASIGLFTSSFMLASAIMAPKMGSLSDVHGRKKIMLFGLIGDVLLGVLTGLAPSWYWLLLIRVINGFVSSAAMLSVEALLIDTVSPHQRGEASGFVMSMGMIGRNLGPLFGGLIQALAYTQGLSLIDSYRVPYFVDSLLAGLAVFLVVGIIQEPPAKNSPRSQQDALMRHRTGSVTMSFSFKVLLLTTFVTGISVGFIMPIMSLFYIDKFGIEPVEIGLILSVSGFIGLLASWTAGRLSDISGRKPFIAGGSFLARFSGLVLPVTSSVTQAAVVLSVRSLGFNIYMPAMRALRADLTPAETRGRFFGLFTTAFRAGDVIGPLIGTYLYDLYRFTSFDIGGVSLPGYGIPFVVNSILGLITTLLLLVLVKEPVHLAGGPSS